jgi:hypothetical protein
VNNLLRLMLPFVEYGYGQITIFFAPRAFCT